MVITVEKPNHIKMYKPTQYKSSGIDFYSFMPFLKFSAY